MYSFPSLIKKIRISAGLTQKEFAKILGVSTILVSMIESGQKEVSKKFVGKLAKVLDVNPGSITPFLFIYNDSDIKNVSGIEKKIINLGEELQIFLIEKKAKSLKIHAR